MKLRSWLAWLLIGAGAANSATPVNANDVKLITLDPGHFHAALLQKEMLAGVSERVHVYAPVGPDLIAHLNRIAQFNGRSDHPTRWTMEVHAGPDFFERMLAERPGDVVVLSGNNRGKIDRIHAMAERGLHVLADKPWIIEPEELPKLETALQAAEQKNVVIFDAMTQRFEVSCLLQKALVNDREIFGECLTGSDDTPSVYLESVHYLLKEVAGLPLLRPSWFFDIRQQGEGLTDAGTHLVDLVQWTLFPDQTIDFRKEIQVQRGQRWPTVLSREQFGRVTGLNGFPSFLQLSHPRSEKSAAQLSPIADPQHPMERSLPTSAATHDDRLEYFANNRVEYTLRGLHVRLDIRWEFEAPPGAKDTELAIFRGSRSRIDVRQGAAERYQPELYVVPNRPEEKTAVLEALRRRVAALHKQYPGVTVEEWMDGAHVIIPGRHRIGHEAHFELLTRRFLQYVRQPTLLPSWEKSALLAKYFVTTKGVELARRDPSAPVPARPETSHYEKTNPLPPGPRP